MTLFALEDDSTDESVHHIDHIIGQATGQHLSQMKETKAETEGGNLHEVIHIIAEIRDLLESGDISEAAHELEELTGTAHEEEHEDDGSGHAH